MSPRQYLLLPLLLLLALPAGPASAAELLLTIVSGKLDRRKHRKPVNPRMRVEIKDRILRSEPQSATLTPRWDYTVTLGLEEVRTSRFIDFILYDYVGPGPDDETMIAGKRLFPKDLLKPGTRQMRIGSAEVVYKVDLVAGKAEVPAPAAPQAAPSAAPAAPVPRMARLARPRPGPPIPPLRLFELPEARRTVARRVSRAATPDGRSIQGVIDAHSADIDECHAKADNPYGEVALLFSISADGTPMGVVVERASANLREAGECMRHRALRWRFPASHGVVTARHLLTFEP